MVDRSLYNHVTAVEWLIYQLYTQIITWKNEKKVIS
jgi:hypothetical protein